MKTFIMECEVPAGAQTLPFVTFTVDLCTREGLRTAGNLSKRGFGEFTMIGIMVNDPIPGVTFTNTYSPVVSGPWNSQ